MRARKILNEHGRENIIVEFESTADELAYRLATHDWFYQYSDDPRAYRRGNDEHQHIQHLMGQLEPAQVYAIIWTTRIPNEAWTRLLEFWKDQLPEPEEASEPE